MPDKIKEVYELISDKGYFTDENEFRSFVTDPNKRSEAYELLKDDGFFTDANEFNSYFEPEKKKTTQISTQPFAAPFQGGGESVKLPSQSKLISTSTTTPTTPKPKVEKPIQLQQRTPSGQPDFVAPQEVVKQLTERGQAPYDEVKERNRIQNGSQGLKKAQIKASEQLIQRDELLAQVEEAKIALEQAKANPQEYNALVPQYNELIKQANQVTDNLKGELAKIDIYEKGITATQLKMTMNEDSGDARWQYGVNEAKQILLQTLPTTARYMGYFAARTRGIPADMAEKVSTDLVEQNFGGIVDTARELAAENEELQQVFTKESAWEAIKEGDMAKTTDLAAKELAQTLPATLGLMATYLNPYVGAFATIMGTAGTELESMDSEDMSPDAKMLNGLVKGGLEYATEKIFGTIPMVKRAIGAKSKAGQEALQNVVLETWNKYAKKMGFGADVIEEVGSEMLNTIGGNYTDYLTGKTDDLQLLKDIGKTFTTSLSMAALLSGGARAMKYGNKDIDKLREDTKKLKEIAARQETTPEVLEVIQENIIANNEKIGDESEKEKKVFDSMTEDEWDEATALIQENQSLQEQIEAGEVQPEILPLVEKKIEENTAQVEAIKEEVKLTLDQRIEALNKLKQQENELTDSKGDTNTSNQGLEVAEPTIEAGVSEDKKGEAQEEVTSIKIKNPLKLNGEEIGLAEMEGENPSDKYSVRQFFSKKYDDVGVPRIGNPEFETFLEENKPNTKETEVLISDITPTQALLDKKGIGGKLTEGNPIAVRFKGSKKIYLLDGHHRTSTEVAKGNKKIKLDLIDIDKTLDDYENDKAQDFINKYNKELTPEQKVKELRAQEQSDLKEAIPNIDEFKDTYGEEQGNMPDDLYAIYKPIYDRYNTLITEAQGKKRSEKESFTEEEDKKIKDIAIEANNKVGSYVKSVPTGKKNKFGNNINEYEATNPFTNEKVIFKKQSDASQYVIDEIAKANTKNGREGIFKSIQPQVEAKEVPALEDVESTAKALENAPNTGQKYLDYSVYDNIQNELTSQSDRAKNKKAAIELAKKEVSEIRRGIYGTESGRSYAEKLKSASDLVADLEAASLNDKRFRNSFTSAEMAEAYHKAKKDGSNPELVKAVEELLGQKDSPSVQVEAQEPILSESTSSESKTKIEDEKTNQKEDVEPLLGGLQANRNEEQGGEASPELRASKESKTKEVKAKTTVDLLKEAFKNKSKKVKVVFKPAYNEKEHGNLSEKLKKSLKVNKVSEFDVISESESILSLVDNKDVLSIEYISEPTKELSKTDAAITALNKLKVDTKNKSFDAVLGIPIGVWNATIDTITLSIKSGVAISDAIKRGLNYIQKNHRGAWDKKGFNAKVIEELGLRGIEVNGEDLIVKPIEKEFASVVDGFYSDLEQSLLDTRKDNLSGSEWISTLSNNDEANWTGLTDWLNSQEGKVSKADIRKYLKDNKIEVVEVVKGDDLIPIKLNWNKKQFDIDDYNSTIGSNEEIEYVLEDEEVGYEIIKTDDAFYVRDSRGENIFKDGDYNNEIKSLEDAKNVAGLNLAENNKRSTDDTKFSQYQLEGEKENYKEVLVTLPQKDLSKPKDAKYNQLIKERLKLVDDFDEAENRAMSRDKGEAQKGDKDRRLIEKRLDEVRNEMIAYEPKTEKVKFKSSHFDEPNILVHLRMNTRKDSQGNKVLFLEEVQSDWGQSGKKEGFKEPSFEWDTQLGKDAVVVLKKMNETAGFSDWKGLATAMAKSNDILNDFQVPYDNKDLMLKWHKAVNQERKVPAAPFVTDTNAWTKLGLKVALKEAVNQGADKIAWTTGEQQNDRYDLSKQVDKIDVEAVKDVDGLFFVDIKLSNGTTENLEVENGIIREGSYKGQRLDNVIGKDYADKILSTPKGESKTLEGQDLKVGGKGMKGFYGSPTERAKANELTIEKVGNKFKVGSRLFEKESEAKKYIDEYGLGIVGSVAKSLFKQEPKAIKIEKWKRGQEVFDTKKEAEKYISRFTKQDIAEFGEPQIEESDGKFEVVTIATSTQNSIDITPELKESVESGLPLFGNIIKALERMKSDQRGKMNAFGILPATWNAAIDTIILGIKAGRVISEVVQEAIDYIKEKHGSFDVEAFKQYLVDGGVAMEGELDGITVEEEVVEEESEEVPPIEPPKPPKGEGEGMTPSEGMEISKHYKTVMANTTLEDLSSSLDQIDFEYKPVSMEEDRVAAMAYLKKNGIERSLLNLASRNVDGLTKSEEIQLAALLYASLNKAMKEALAAGNRELADAIFNEAKPLTRVTTKLGTDYGRAVNAFKAFALDFSDPVTAAFNLEKAVEEANKIEMEKASNKKNATSTANTINNDVKKGKKKTVKEVVKTLNEELYGQITKGGKGLTTEQKAKIKNIFNEFKVDTTTLKSANPIKAIAAGLLTPKVYNAFIDKVGDLVTEGVSLGIAVTRVSAEFIRNKVASPKELVEARKALNEQVNGLKTKKEPTKSQLERKAASEELKEEVKKFNAEKELADYKEKQQKKAESLRKKDAEKVLTEVEKLELQRVQQLAKEATELEEELRKDRKRIADLKAKEETDRKDRIAKLELQRSQQAAKEATELQNELAKDRKRIADLKAKEETDRQDRVAKLELQRAQQKLKETEKAIKELTSEIQKNDSDLVAEILDEYLSLEGDVKTNNQKLIDMVKDKLGVSDAQAKVIATKIAKGVAVNIKAKLETKFANQLSEEEKAAKKNGSKPKANPLDDLIRAANLGITPELVMDFFKNKYGIKEVTIDDIQAIQELAKSVATAPTKSRRGVLLGKIQDMLNSKKNKTTAELLTNLWHARVLSSVFLGVFGTGDTNVTYNLLTLALNTFEYPATIGVRTVKEVANEIAKRIKSGKIDKRIIKDIVKDSVLDITNGALKSIGQTIIYDEKEIKSMEIFLSALKNTKYLQQSLSYLKTASLEGSNFKKEYDNPFKATAGTTFDLANYISLFKKAENGDKDAQARIVQMVRKVTNAYVNGVTNILSGQDLFFGSIISNAYIVPLMREQLEKEGLSEKEINKEMINRLFNTKVEYENARNTAIKNRMQYDITFELKVNEEGESVYIIKDKGKEVKERAFGRTPKQFDTKQDAIDYAVENVAPSGNAFKNDTIDILNEKIGTEIQTKADKIAQNELLSADVEGGTRYLMQLSNNILGILEQVSTYLNEYSKEVSMYNWSELGSMAKGLDPMVIPRIAKKVISEAINFVSVMIYSLRNMLAYLRVGLNALRNQSSYIAPIGLLRYFRSMTNKNMGAFGKLTYEISETERNKILTKALLGGYFTYVGAVLPLLLAGEDDEEEKEVKERFANWYKETTGEELQGEQKNFFLNLKEGQAIGTLEWMTPAQQKFYKRTGLIIENSTFDGFGEDGKPIFSTIKNRPQFAGASLVSTYQLIQAFGNEEQKEEGAAMLQAAKTPLYQWKDMSIGQGGISLLFSNMKSGDIAKKIAQSAILDNFEVLNPSVIRVGLQVLDTKMRRNDDLFTALENEATISGGVQRWMLNRILPVYAGYNQAMKAPQIYGMFGEELYRVPAESQGLVGSTIAKYVNSGKNIEQKNMYVFLDDNGYKKIWEWNKNIPIFLPTKVGAEPQLLTRDEIDKYGMIAGRKTLEELKANLSKLSLIRNNASVSDEDAQKDFNGYVDEIFKKNFRIAYFESNNAFEGNTEAAVDNIQERFDAKINKDYNKVKDDIAAGVTSLSEEDLLLKKAFRNNVESAIKYFSEMEGAIKTQDEIKRLVKLKVLTKEQGEQVEKTLIN